MNGERMGGDRRDDDRIGGERMDGERVDGEEVGPHVRCDGAKIWRAVNNVLERKWRERHSEEVNNILENIEKMTRADRAFFIRENIQETLRVARNIRPSETAGTTWRTEWSSVPEAEAVEDQRQAAESFPSADSTVVAGAGDARMMGGRPRGPCEQCGTYGVVWDVAMVGMLCDECLRAPAVHASGLSDAVGGPASGE